MPSRLPPKLLKDLAGAGVRVVRASAITRAGSAAAYRLECTDGSSVKLRVFATESRAAEVWRLLGLTRPGLLPERRVRVGRALVVDYVPGTALSTRTASETRVVRFAGAWLALLHATPLSARERSHAMWPARDLVEVVAAALVRRRLLTRASADVLSALRRPASSPVALTHTDVCPENLVRSLQGSLRVIDEERLGVRPAAFDLARAITRWPLDAAMERELLRRYARAGGRPGHFIDHRAFWLATALAVSAKYRLRKRLPGVRRIAAALAIVATSQRGAARSVSG